MATSAATSSLENELTCSICTDILYDPVTLLDCLHTHCGACAKSWFEQQQQNLQSHTCPLCRKAVRDARPNSTVTNLLELFLAQHPEKKRSDEDVAEMRRKFKPGDSILASAESAEESTPLRSARANSGPSEFGTLSFEHAGPDMRNFEQEMALLRSLMPSLAFSGRAPTSPTLRSNGPSQPRTIFPPSPFQNSPQRNNFAFHSPLEFSPITSPLLSSPTSPSSSSSPTSRSSFGSPSISGGKIAEILQRSQGRAPIGINCDHCRSTISDEVHHECTQCPMYHLCQRCIRNGKTCPQGHQMWQQRLCQRAEQRYQLERGVFCSVCEAWTDADCTLDQSRISANNTFWCCTECNDRKGWTYCLDCVRKGRNCTHDLKLWTNRRGINSGPQSLVVGGRGVFGDPSSSDAYVRRRRYNYYCDVCTGEIPASHSWLHCTTCAGGNWDVCCGCFYSSDADGAEDVFRCPQGHEMTFVTTINDEPGTRKVVTSPSGVLPEFVEDPEHVERWTAVATRAYWPEDCLVRGAGQGERKWGANGALGFPKGAHISDVVECFSYSEEDEVKTVCWGWYCGVGGVFDMSAVRLVNM